MGYYCYIEFDVKVPKENVKKFNEEINKHIFGNGIEATQEGDIVFKDGDYFRKLYYEEELMLFISKFVKDGMIYLKGEDGLKWAYKFEEDGVYEMYIEEKYIKGQKLGK